MRIHRDPELADLIILDPGRDLNGHDAETAVQEVETLIMQGVRRVIVNLNGVQHVSSDGLGMLIRIQHRLRRRQGDLKVAGAAGIADEALRMTRLNLVFDVQPDVASARRAFTAGAASSRVRSEVSGGA